MTKNLQHTPRVLLSIVTWNHASAIKATLDSIRMQTYSGYRLVVYDNNSSDGTADVVESLAKDMDLTLIRNNNNVGFCGGHNHVLNNFGFDYVFLVNPDIVLKEDYIERTLAAFEHDPKIGAVCGLLVQSFEENPVIDSTGMMITKSRRFSLINHGLRLNEVQVQSGYVAGLDGALPAFRKEAIEDLSINGNLFNQLFFAHKEDWDVSWRLILFGWTTYFNRDSVAVHPRHFRPNDIKTRMMINSKIKFDAFKNQLLLLLINEDGKNFFRDSLVIIPRLVVVSFFCLFFERKSLKAFSYVVANRKQISHIRREVQRKRAISSSNFRRYLNWKGATDGLSIAE